MSGLSHAGNTRNRGYAPRSIPPAPRPAAYAGAHLWSHRPGLQGQLLWVPCTWPPRSLPSGAARHRHSSERLQDLLPAGLLETSSCCHLALSRALAGEVLGGQVFFVVLICLLALGIYQSLACWPLRRTCSHLTEEPTHEEPPLLRLSEFRHSDPWGSPEFLLSFLKLLM